MILLNLVSIDTPTTKRTRKPNQIFTSLERMTNNEMKEKGLKEKTNTNKAHP